MNLRANNDKTWQTIAVFALAVVAVFIFRSIWTFPIEHGDAVQKYFHAANILRTGDWTILLHNHHTMRWTAMLPQVGLTWLFGTRYEVFYILPLLMFSLCFVLIIFSMKDILNRYQLCLLAVILFLEPLEFSTSNQLLNPPFAIFFAFAGILVLTRDQKQSTATVIGSAILFFMAYGAHVTYLSLAAGAFAWLAVIQHRYSRAAIFSVAIIALIGVEILIYNYLSGWQVNLGRLELLAQSHHMERALETKPPIHFLQLLTRWMNVPLPNFLLFCLFMIGGPWLIWQRHRGIAIPTIISCTYLVALSFALAVTFAVVSVNPLKPAMGIRPMYLIPFFPLAAVIAIYGLSDAYAVTNRIAPTWLKNTVVLTLVVFLLTWPISGPPLYRKGYEFFIRDANVFFAWKAHDEYSAFSDKFRRGELILSGQRKRVYNLIARFETPQKFVNREQGISVPNPVPDAKCVNRLNKIPLYLNYEQCSL